MWPNYGLLRRPNYEQPRTLVRPGLLVAYRVKLSRVVNFRAGYNPARWPPLWQDLECNWKRLAFYDRIEPPSWGIADVVRAAGFAGILFPSTRRAGGMNLVVYPDQLTAEDQLTPNDPSGELPADQSIWA